MQLTPSQNRYVNKLIDAFDKKENYKFASFKAPTGAGKTFMASEFISRVFAKEFVTDKKTIFVVATISNAELPKQFSKKLNIYKQFHEFNNYNIEYIESPSISSSKKAKSEDIKEFVLEENKVFVFGISSFGKNTLFHQNRTLETFLEQARELNYQIFFIRDEAHIGKKEKCSKDELKNFDQKMNESANFIINMTATPKDKQNLIEMTSEDMREDGFHLLKTEQIKTQLADEVSNKEIIDDAIQTFLRTKEEYRTINDAIINPAMLIQVMNESDYEKDPVKNNQFHEELNLLEKKLKENGLIYLKYLNNSPEIIGSNLPNTLDYASQIDSKIDVIIFKVGPATGWDIPRANMLLQLRNVSSESLNMQTIGRIMRNPYPNLQENEITKKYYIWSNYQQPTRDESFYKLKSKFKDEKFFSGRISLESRIVIDSNENYRKDVLEFIKSVEFKNKIQDFEPTRDIIYNQTKYGNSIVKNKIPNHIYLKIYIQQERNKLENELKLSLFEEELINISNLYEKNINIIWYIFINFAQRLNEIKQKNSKWIHELEPYKLVKNAQTREHYSLWKDNENPKFVKTDSFENYGYIQVHENENIQFLDSTPEMKFYQTFDKNVSQAQRKDISFFAKMPTLGSQVYFEYYSNKQGKITKSFIDFAIKYKNKLIMVEVKARGEDDYDEEKTKELLDAYKIYMEKFKSENVSLILYQYDKKIDTPFANAFIDNEWKKDLSFQEIFNHFFNEN